MPHGQFLTSTFVGNESLSSPDHQEAMAAYREKREPGFNLTRCSVKRTEEK
jgi:hypothetical protein